jgi:hypothetical protein
MNVSNYGPKLPLQFIFTSFGKPWLMLAMKICRNSLTT